MKKAILFILLILISHLNLYSQCKPDLDKVDKIDKTVIKVWEIKLGSLGFGASLLSKENKDWSAYLSYSRSKNQNYITFSVVQTFGENESANISRFFAGKNMELALAFDGDSPPVKFQSQIPQYSQAKVLGLIQHQVHLSQIMNEDKMKELKEAFDKGEVSAFRIVLGGGQQIEKSIRDRRAEDVKAKFYCFYDFSIANPVKEIASFDLSSILKKDETTNKYTFSEVVNIDKTQKELYKKATSWLVKNSPDKRTNHEDETAGTAIASCTYRVTYNTNNLVSEDLYKFNMTISVKEGRYKYILTDIVMNDGKKVASLESLVEQVKARPDLIETALKEIKTNIDKIIQSLKSEMEGKSDDW